MARGANGGGALLALGLALACVSAGLFFGAAWGFALAALLCLALGVALSLKR